jgi:hypothetical protein
MEGGGGGLVAQTKHTVVVSIVFVVYFFRGLTRKCETKIQTIYINVCFVKMTGKFV